MYQFIVTNCSNCEFKDVCKYREDLSNSNNEICSCLEKITKAYVLPLDITLKCRYYTLKTNERIR